MDAEISKLESALTLSRNSRQSISRGAASLASKADAVSKEYRVVVADTRRQLDDMKTVLRTQLSDAVMFKLRVSWLGDSKFPWCCVCLF